MANPLKVLEKLKGRSLKEIQTRSGQAISAYTEKIGIGSRLPSDSEIFSGIDRHYLNGKKPTAESLYNAFFRIGKDSFFSTFTQKEEIVKRLRSFRGSNQIKTFERAAKIFDGKFDLLGYENLDFKTPINFHFEPVSQKYSPMKHWKTFDELSAEETGDKKIVWELNRHQYFFTLGAAYWLSDDEEYAKTFVNHLKMWMEQNPPGTGVNWLSSLEVSFRAMSWIWAFHLFKGSRYFTPELFLKAVKFLDLHGRHIEKYLSTYYSPNTHLTGEALGLYYLGTQLPFLKDSERRRKIGEEILFAEPEKQIWDDGVYFEQSTWYARYTAEFYLHFLILRYRQGENKDFENGAKLQTRLQLLLDFLMNITRPDGTTPLIGDDDGGKMLPLSGRVSNDFRSTLVTGAVLFERGDYKYVARDFSEETLWLLGTKGEEVFEVLPAHKPEYYSKSFESGGYFVMRDGWETTDNFLLIDGGTAGALTGGHSHADTLAIDLAVGGKTMLADPGTYSYHESEEIRNYFRSSEAHNTLSINNKSSYEFGNKFNWKSTANPQVGFWIPESRFDFFEGSHDGYARLEKPAIHTRSVLFLKNDYWVMRDFVETLGEHKFQLNFNFYLNTNPRITEKDSFGMCVVEETNEASGVRICSFGDKGIWQFGENFISTNYGKKESSTSFQFLTKDTGPQEFFTFILPSVSKDDKPEVFETDINGGRAFVVNCRKYQDIFVFSDGLGLIKTEYFETDFRYTWARFSDGESLPEEIVAVDGRDFSFNGIGLTERQEKIKALSVRRLGKILNVKADDKVSSLKLS